MEGCRFWLPRCLFFIFLMTSLTVVFFAGFRSSSALMRHEIAYVLGQMQEEVTVEALTRQLENVKENNMVRHECAEALGSIGNPQCTEILTVSAHARYCHCVCKHCVSRLLMGEQLFLEILER